jgi:hypothetical protein
MCNNQNIIIIFAFLLITVSCQADYIYDDGNYQNNGTADNDMNNLNDTIGYDDSLMNNNIESSYDSSSDSGGSGYIYDNTSDFSSENENDSNYDISPDNNGSTSGIFYSLG